MTLKLRVIIFISSIFGALALSVYLVFNTILMRGYLELEEQSVRQNVARALEGVGSLKDEIALKAQEWGTWDDSYNFIFKRSKNYEQSNLTFEALDQLHLRHFLLIDNNNNVVKALYVDPESGTLKALTDESFKILSRIAIKALSEKKILGGLVSLPGANFLVGASPVTNSAGDVPANGAILFTRDFDEKTFERLRELTRISLAISPITEGELPSNPSLIQPLKIISNNAEIYGIDTIRDIFERPILKVAVTLQRDVLAKGIQARNLLTSYVAFFTFIALGCALIFLNRIVIRPLRIIGEQTAAIGMTQTDDLRVEVIGDSELRHLSTEINRMLDKLSLSKSEIISAKNAAESANAAKSMFISRVSHELRNPIQGIMGLNGMILKREGSRAVWDLVRMSDMAAHGILSIVSEILDFFKAEAGELSFEKKPFAIRQVVRETMLVVAARLDGRYKPSDTERVELVVDVNPNVPQQVIGDPTKLKQILINLLGNSVKFTHKGYVGLKIYCDTIISPPDLYRIKIEVWDTGIGIAEDKLETVFKPFKQAEDSIAHKYHGTGLGLSIVKEFSEGQGGEVSVSSKLGEGSTFTVAMPFRAGPEQGVVLLGAGNQEEASRQQQPTPTVLVGRSSKAIDAILENLLALGVSVSQFDPFDFENVANLELQFKGASLLFVSEEVFALSEAEKLLQHRVQTKKITVASVRPSSLDLREKLYQLGLEYVLTAPVLADDLMLAYQGKLPKSNSTGEKDVTPQLKAKGPLNILIADDMPTNLLILEDLLLSAGHNVTTVRDGSETVELVSPMLKHEPGAKKFDLIITDITMSIMNGDDAARAIRDLETKHSPKQHIPIIAVTGHVFDGDREKMKEAGIDGVLTKPMSPEMLAAEFARLLGVQNFSAQA